MKDDDDDVMMVCTKHLKFAPCRPCLYADPEGGSWYSSDPEDVEKVREYQWGE